MFFFVNTTSYYCVSAKLAILLIKLFFNILSYLFFSIFIIFLMKIFVFKKHYILINFLSRKIKLTNKSMHKLIFRIKRIVN